MVSAQARNKSVLGGRIQNLYRWLLFAPSPKKNIGTHVFVKIAFDTKIVRHELGEWCVATQYYLLSRYKTNTITYMSTWRIPKPLFEIIIQLSVSILREACYFRSIISKKIGTAFYISVELFMSQNRTRSIRLRSLRAKLWGGCWKVSGGRATSGRPLATRPRDVVVGAAAGPYLFFLHDGNSVARL